MQDMRSKKHTTRKTRKVSPLYNSYIWAARIIIDLLVLSYLLLLLNYYFNLF